MIECPQCGKMMQLSNKWVLKKSPEGKHYEYKHYFIECVRCHEIFTNIEVQEMNKMSNEQALEARRNRIDID